jgi:hypothetical protein
MEEVALTSGNCLDACHVVCGRKHIDFEASFVNPTPALVISTSSE